MRSVSQRGATFCLALVLGVGNGLACAESTSVKDAGARAVAAAHLDFKIVIPEVLQMNSGLGTIFSNAHRAQTIVFATSDIGLRRAISTRSDPRSIGAAIDALAHDSGRSPVGYTVAMP
jgi:hypothetical protein